MTRKTSSTRVPSIVEVYETECVNNELLNISMVVNKKYLLGIICKVNISCQHIDFSLS